MRTTLRKLPRAVRLAGILSGVFAWGLLAETRDTWSLGSTSFVTPQGLPPSPILQETMDSEMDYEQLKGVGGVAFQVVARPGAGLEEPPALFYDPTRPDGDRLLVRLAEELVTSELPDWLLIPIARFADSEYNACVSLVTAASEDRYDITYHSAFVDTLLGMRLLQADILLMKMGEYWNLPKLGGSYVVGLGETLPDEEQKRRSLRAAREIDDTLALEVYDSWVLTDTGEQVEFSAEEGGRLKLTGEPYFFFWSAGYESYEWTTEHFGEWFRSLTSENEKYRQEVELSNEKLRKLSAERERWISEGHEAIAELRRRPPDPDSLQQHIDAIKARVKDLKRQLDVEEARGGFMADKSRELVDWNDRLVRIANQLRPEVVKDDELTAALQKQRDQLEMFNPPVYNAARQVMRFAALFRYVKQANPTAWSQFLGQLDGLKAEKFRTPIQMPKPRRARAERPAGSRADQGL